MFLYDINREESQMTLRSTGSLCFALCAAAPFVDAASTESTSESRTSQQISRAGSQASVAGPADSFTGRVRVDPLFPATDEIDASGAYVSFEPGARSAWHTHPAGQRLVVISGVGLTQEWGKPVQQILPGDVIVCPPGVKHWHGAAPTSAMTHLAVTGTVEGKKTWSGWRRSAKNNTAPLECRRHRPSRMPWRFRKPYRPSSKPYR
nr:hypothetical protein GCM10020185_81120 [Pseudomonas brassicacearum subsp. brassicacearum]